MARGIRNQCILLSAVYCGKEGEYGLNSNIEYFFYLRQEKDSIVKLYFKDTNKWFEYASILVFFSNFTDIIPFGKYWISLSGQGSTLKITATKIENYDIKLHK